MTDSSGMNVKITDIYSVKSSKEIIHDASLNINNINGNNTINDNIHELLIRGCTYFDILLYNCYDDKTRIMNRDKLSTAFDDLIDNYSNLFDFGISLSGYQFVGIILENNLATTQSTHIQVAYFILSTGFLISMFGVLICFITIEYLRGCREESTEFIVAGINKYKTLFKLGDIILYTDCILFVVPINILIYNSLASHYGIIYNILCGVLFILGVGFHYSVIISKQQYNVSRAEINNGEKFDTDFCNIICKALGCDEEYAYKRKLFNRNDETKEE